MENARKLFLNFSALQRWRYSEPEGPRCHCSFCGLPIGAAEDDPRWNSHDEDCIGCEVCEIALRLWPQNLEGAAWEIRLHQACMALLMEEARLQGKGEGDGKGSG